MISSIVNTRMTRIKHISTQTHERVEIKGDYLLGRYLCTTTLII